MQNIRKIRHIFIYMWNPGFRDSSEILPSYAIPYAISHPISYAIPPFTFTDGYFPHTYDVF